MSPRFILLQYLILLLKNFLCLAFSGVDSFDMLGFSSLKKSTRRTCLPVRSKIFNYKFMTRFGVTSVLTLLRLPLRCSSISLWNWFCERHDSQAQSRITDHCGTEEPTIYIVVDSIGLGTIISLKISEFSYIENWILTLNLHGNCVKYRFGQVMMLK